MRKSPYHVSLMGKLGNELTEAPAVATVLGVEDKIEGAMFDAVQTARRQRRRRYSAGVHGGRHRCRYL